MGYVLSGTGAWNDRAPIERRANSALGALRAYLAYVRQDQLASIRDDAGEPVSLARLLELANRDAANDSSARRQIVSVLADLVDASLRPWDDAAPDVQPPPVYWRNAGQTWALQFGQEPPGPLVDELGDRHANPRCDLLLAAAREFLAQRPSRRLVPGCPLSPTPPRGRPPGRRP